MTKILRCRPGVWACAAGAAAGFLNGFLGTGGGMVLIFALRPLMGGGDEDGAKDVMATVLAAMLPMTALSAALYLFRGGVEIAENWVYLPAAVAGGIIGALLLDKFNVKTIRSVFAVLLIVAGGRMLFG